MLFRSSGYETIRKKFTLSVVAAGVGTILHLKLRHSVTAGRDAMSGAFR